MSYRIVIIAILKNLKSHKKVMEFFFSKVVGYNLFRSSHWRCSIKKGVLRNFAKSTGKHLCQTLFFNKIAGLRPLLKHFIKKESLAQIFSCEFCEISKNTIFTEHLRTTASTYLRKDFIKGSFM